MQIKNEVGINAGYVWNLLSTKGKMSIKEICKYVDCSDPLMLMVMGWLLREDKIQCQDEGGTIFVELKPCPSEMYFG